MFLTYVVVMQLIFKTTKQKLMIIVKIFDTLYIQTITIQYNQYNDFANKMNLKPIKWRYFRYNKDIIDTLTIDKMTI